MKRKTNVHGLWMVLAAALPLGLSAGCGVDDNNATDPATGDEIQAVTGVCRINRPYGWSVGLNSCAEWLLRPQYILLNPGQQRTFFSGQIVGKGDGYVTVECHANGDGWWSEIEKVCQRSTQ